MMQFRALLDQLSILIEAPAMKIGAISKRKDGDYEKIGPNKWRRVVAQKTSAPEPVSPPTPTVPKVEPVKKSRARKQKSSEIGSQPGPFKPVEKPVKAAKKDKPNKSNSAVEACARGDFSSARGEIETRLAEMGLKPSFGSKKTVVVSDEGLAESGVTGGSAIAFRDPDGHIQIASGMARSLQGLKDVAKFGGIKAAYDEFKAGEAAARQSMPGIAKGTASKEERAHVERIGQLGAALSKASALQNLTHETLHGYSPGALEAYEGIGALVEEVSTEVMAQQMSRDWYGFRAIPGSYDGMISDVEKIIAKHSSIPKDKVREYLEKASKRYKSRSKKIPSAEAVGRAFAEDLAKETGGNEAEIARDLSNLRLRTS